MRNTFRNTIANLANCIMQNVRGLVAMLRRVFVELFYSHPSASAEPALLPAAALRLRDAKASDLHFGSTRWQAALGRPLPVVAVLSLGQTVLQQAGRQGQPGQTQPTTIVGTVCRAIGRAFGA